MVGNRSGLEKIIGLFFASEGGGCAVAGIEGPVAGEGDKFAQGAGQGSGVAAGEVGATGGALKEGISGEEGPVVLQAPADSPGGVSGGFQDRPAGAGQFQGGVFHDRYQRRGGGFRSVIEAGKGVAGRKAPGGIEGMEIDGRRVCLAEVGEGGDVVDMAVGEQIGHHGGTSFLEVADQLRGVIARVQNDGFARGGVRDEITIFFDKTGDSCFNIHGMKPADSSGRVKGGADAVLTVSGLGVGLMTQGGGRLEVVSGVDLVLRAGRTTALVGESGCGKSITAAALGGLLPRGMVRDQGEIRWASGERGGPGQGLAYVFQDPGECLDPVFTIGNQIREMLPRAERGRAGERMEELLRTVGFEDPRRVLASYPHQLSGGMQQRAMLAMALAGRPRVLVADEPTTALDVTVQAKILRLLADLQRRENLAVMLITHNLGVVAEVADEVHVMYAGRVVESGPVELLNKPGHPYVNGLLKALPRLGGTGERLEGIEGSVPPLGRRPAGCRFHPRCGLARELCREKEPGMRGGWGGRAVACWACGAGGWA